MLKIAVLVVILAALSGCKITHKVSLDELSTEYFQGHESIKVIQANQIFALSDEAKDFAKHYTKMARSDSDKTEKLLTALFSANKLNLDYRARANTTATETFESGVANCISLTILAYAMFDHVGIPAVIQDVQIPEFWTVRDRDVLINGHVNLRVRPRDHNPLDSLMSSDIIIDFDPNAEAAGFRAKELTDRQLISFYYNNIGAEALMIGDYITAYAYFSAAIQAYSRNDSVWVNLGALYSRVGALDEAEKAYRYATKLNGRSLSALENLAIVLNKQGDSKSAESIFARLHKKRSKNPYYHLLLGDQALNNSDAALALKHYQKAIELNDKAHTFYFALARAYMQLGDIEASKTSLQQAKRLSDDLKLNEFYARKLSLFAKR